MNGIDIRGHHLRNLNDILQRFGPSRFNSTNYSEFYRYYRDNDYAHNAFKKIIENPYLKVTITNSIDYICDLCGHHDDTGCTKPGESEEELKFLDRRIINDFELTLGRSYSSDDLLFKLRRKINN